LNKDAFNVLIYQPQITKNKRKKKSNRIEWRGFERKK